MKHLRLLLTLLSFLPATLLSAQNFTSILVFGDSLSDTGNVAHLTAAQYAGLRIPGPLADYTDGRFTDGPDTTPSTSTAGVWIEQLAAALATHPAVKNSLDSGANYAYGYAFTGTGTTPLTLSMTPPVAVNVDNLGQQVTDYLTAHAAPIPAGTLVVLWGGANDVLSAIAAADPTTAQTGITTAVTGEITALQRLIAAGATDILVNNLPPLGAIPRLNGSPATAAAGTQASSAFNSALAARIAALPASSTVHIYQLDVAALFNKVIANPATYKLTDTIGSSQGKPTVNPDTYIFWDDLHPTTIVHGLIAQAALAAITPIVTPSVTATLSASTLTVAGGVSGTTTVTLSAAGGFGGTVAYACGTLPLHAACNFAPPSVSFAGTTAAQTSTLVVNTNGASPAAASLTPSSSTTAAALLLPLTGFGSLLALRRRRHIHPSLLALLLALATTGLLGLTACGGKSSSPNTNTPAGTYIIPISITPSSGAAPSSLTLTLVVQ